MSFRLFFSILYWSKLNLVLLLSNLKLSNTFWLDSIGNKSPKLFICDSRQWITLDNFLASRIGKNRKKLDWTEKKTTKKKLLFCLHLSLVRVLLWNYGIHFDRENAEDGGLYEFFQNYWLGILEENFESINFRFCFNFIFSFSFLIPKYPSLPPVNLRIFILNAIYFQPGQTFWS